MKKFRVFILAHPPRFGGHGHTAERGAHGYVNSTLYKTCRTHKSSFAFVFIAIFIFDSGGNSI